MMLRNKISEEFSSSYNKDWKEVNLMCIAVNYHLGRYVNTTSKRLKAKHMRYLLYKYYQLDHWLKTHPNYTMDYAQRGIVISVKYEVRTHFNRRCIDED